MSPLKSFGCSICGAQAPEKFRKHGMEEERWSWLRRHYKNRHPWQWTQWMTKVRKTRKQVKRNER